MSNKYPKADLWAKEMNFKSFEDPKKGCAYCKHSYCHNPGAYITGLSCKLLEKLIKKNKLDVSKQNKDREWVSYIGLVREYDICDKYNS